MLSQTQLQTYVHALNSAQPYICQKNCPGCYQRFLLLSSLSPSLSLLPCLSVCLKKCLQIFFTLYGFFCPTVVSDSVLQFYWLSYSYWFFPTMVIDSFTVVWLTGQGPWHNPQGVLELRGPVSHRQVSQERRLLEPLLLSCVSVCYK